MRAPPGVLTSMFLQATFFTTAGNRSEAFFPRAIIWWWGQGGERREAATLVRLRPTGGRGELPLAPACPVPAHRHNPLHGLQLEGVLVGIQHLLQVVMPGGSRRGHGGHKGGVGCPSGGSSRKQGHGQGRLGQTPTQRRQGGTDQGLGTEKHVGQPMLWVDLCPPQKI